MIDPERSRNTVALLHSDHDPTVYEALIVSHRLRIVYTVRTDVAAVLAALIAVQHALEHVAEVVVIPHLGELEVDTPWWVITEAAVLITGSRRYPVGYAASEVG